MRYIYPENAGVSPSHLPTSCTPEGVSEVLMKVALILHSFSLKCSGFFFYLGFLSRTTFTNLWTAADGGGISLTPHYRGGRHEGPPHPTFFFENPPIKTDVPPHGAHPPLKNEKAQ